MRTVTYSGAVRLDGFLASVDCSIDWLHFSKDVQQVMTDFGLWYDVSRREVRLASCEVSQNSEIANLSQTENSMPANRFDEWPSRRTSK
jgi:hypothetical protein